MAPFGRHGSDSESFVWNVLAPVVDIQTYKNLVYLLLALPLGVTYSLILGFGFILGVGLSLVAVGVVILLAMLPVVRGFASFERWLTDRLLGLTVAKPENATSEEGIRAATRTRLEAESTWRGLGFLTLKFWLGVVGLLLLFAFATAVSMMSSIPRRPHDVEFGEVNGDPVVWTVETLPEAVLATVAGVAVTVFLVHLTNGFGYVARRMAQSLL
jgi:hypothetical protein